LLKASKAMEVHLPSIATEGSKEAASAILQFQAQAGAEDPAAVLKRIEKLEERQRELLKEIADKLLRLDPPKIKEANFI
jgi:nitrate reductase assembly molybdenum cofactor insertion protein NarJ